MDNKHRPSPYTWKGFAVGTFFAAVIGLVAPYTTVILIDSAWGVNSSSHGAIFLFFVFTFFINTCFAIVKRQLALTKADLVMVYVMMLMALTAPGQAFIVYLIPTIGGIQYHATPGNQWADLYIPHIVDWITPQDPRAIQYMYEGLPKGASIPWGAWVTPLACWYVLFLVLGFMMICLSTILHRQWSQHERLTYPMMQLPLQMIEEGKGPLERLGPFFRNPVMWIGFFVPFTILSMTGLHAYFPSIPYVPNVVASISLTDTVAIHFWFRLGWTGFFFLVNVGILFGIWFFFVLGRIQGVIFDTLGIGSTERLSLYHVEGADLIHQQMGACIVFVLFILWTARKHLRDVVRKAWRSDADVEDDDELLPYRVALFGFLFSLAFVAVWLWRSGIPPIVLPLFLGACLVFFIMVTRVVTTAGVATARAPMVAAWFVISGVGTSIIGVKGLVALAFTYVWQAEMRLFPMIACANGLKLAEHIPGPKRRLFWAMMAALVCSLLTATWILLRYCYVEGGINLHSSFMSLRPMDTFENMARLIVNPRVPDLRGWIFTGIGGLVEGSLLVAQSRFYWWPLHPLGFVLSGWLTEHIFLAVFTAWLLKSLILKYWGVKLYNGAKPFFLGLILGEAAVGGFWLVINALMGQTGNAVSAM